LINGVGGRIKMRKNHLMRPPSDVVGIKITSAKGTEEFVYID